MGSSRCTTVFRRGQGEGQGAHRMRHGRGPDRGEQRRLLGEQRIVPAVVTQAGNGPGRAVEGVLSRSGACRCARGTPDGSSPRRAPVPSRGTPRGAAPAGGDPPPAATASLLFRQRGLERPDGAAGSPGVRGVAAGTRRATWMSSCHQSASPPPVSKVSSRAEDRDDGRASCSPGGRRPHRHTPHRHRPATSAAISSSPRRLAAPFIDLGSRADITGSPLPRR